MSDADRIEALLNVADENRSKGQAESGKLVVLGQAERRGKNGYWPTNAGWNLLGDRGRPYDTP